MSGGFAAIDLIRAQNSETTPNVELISGTGIFGAYVELVDPTTLFCNYLTAFIHNPNTGNDYDVDLAIGDAGSEINFLEGLLHHVNLTGMNIITESIPFKVEIPLGVRVSARTRATENTDTVEIKAILQGI